MTYHLSPSSFLVTVSCLHCDHVVKILTEVMVQIQNVFINGNWINNLT